VADNVRRFRNSHRLTVYELADRLKTGGHAIAASAISKIERGERQVTVDDLMALAIALDVPPISLLLPENVRGGVELTGIGAVYPGAKTTAGRRAWAWAQGREPLRYPSGIDEQDRARHLAMWLMTVTPRGLDGFDMTTEKGQRAFMDAMKEWAESGDEGGLDG
jgi:transcriptional regulator with XRE-family HTH domain